MNSFRQLSCFYLTLALVYTVLRGRQWLRGQFEVPSSWHERKASEPNKRAVPCKSSQTTEFGVHEISQRNSLTHQAIWPNVIVSGIFPSEIFPVLQISSTYYFTVDLPPFLVRSFSLSRWRVKPRHFGARLMTAQTESLFQPPKEQYYSDTENIQCLCCECFCYLTKSSGETMTLQHCLFSRFFQR